MRFIYSGGSMAPLFRPGQMLYVKPDAQELRPGDVIIFDDPSRRARVVHRIIAITSEGLITRGDHNLQRDELPVVSGLVVGRVDAVEADGRLRRVSGGRRGLACACARRLALQLRRGLRSLLAHPWRLFSSSPLLRRSLRRFFPLHFEFISLHTALGPEVKALYRGRVVARRQPAQLRFSCRKPFDLWLRESDFPGYPHPDGLDPEA